MTACPRPPPPPLLAKLTGEFLHQVITILCGRSVGFLLHHGGWRTKVRSDWLRFSQFRTCFAGSRKITPDFSNFARKNPGRLSPGSGSASADTSPPIEQRRTREAIDDPPGLGAPTPWGHL